MISLICKVLIYLSYFSGIVPLVILIFRRKNLKLHLLRLVGLVLVLATLSDAISFTLAKSGIPNIPVVNVYFLLLFLLLSTVYAFLLPEWKTGILTIAAFFIAGFLLNVFVYQGIHVIHGYITAVEGVYLILYAIIYYRYLLKILAVVDPTRYLPFWINSGVFLYFSLNLLLFLFSSYAFDHLKEDEVIALWAFHNFNNIVKNIFFSIGIYHSSFGYVEK